MSIVVEYVLIGLAIVIFAFLTAWTILNTIHKPTITWTLVKIGDNATVTIRASSEITECTVASGTGSCSIVRSSMCVCQVTRETVVVVCSHDVCKLIAVK